MLAQILVIVFASISAGLAVAQSSSITLTPFCENTLLSFLSSPDAQCLNVAPLISFSINPAQPVPQATKNWLTGLCGIAPCTDSNIANVVTSLIKGCSEDLSNLDIETTGLQEQIISSVQEAYPVIRQVACLQDSTTGELCVTQALNNVEQVFGKLVVDANLTVDALNQDAQVFLNSNITQIACNNCVKAAYNIGIAKFPNEVAQANPALEGACGGSILDLGIATGINQTALYKRSLTSPVNTNSGFRLAPFISTSHGILALLCASAFLV